MYQISCESTVDLPDSLMRARGIPVLRYAYAVDGREYEDDMGRDPDSLTRFYGFLAEGKLPTTSQLTACQYEAFFESLLRQGDLIHVVFSSGLSGSFNGAQVAARALRERYPDRRLTVVDSLCASGGYGMLVDGLADMKDRGAGMEEAEAWLLQNRLRVNHQFFSTDLRYYRRTGRVSGAAAAIGSVLGICPIMRLDENGRIIAYDKVRGKAQAMRRTLDAALARAENGAEYAGKIWIGHSNCPEDAERLMRMAKESFPKAKDLQIFNIGVVVASHSGPNTVSMYFFGDERTAGKRSV